ncbi:diguanylate cyclase domain-containing protein, partial [Methylobacter tundripaludum]|uniref:diguanylate cyclase domain-containing protein n=1 Tax=Methylobacter tundripaludum TaxID=173365 RepID=UPI0004DF0C6A
AIETLPQHGSLTFIDMDGLKFYNDRFGHERGDELLRTFARHLSERLGVKAQAHRLGGDEFAITCEYGDVTWVESMLTQAVEDLGDSGFKFAGASSGSAHVHETRIKENSSTWPIVECMKISAATSGAVMKIRNQF